jgi:SAM-dependent methyltransferase
VTKLYDRAYFDRWYRGGDRAVHPADVHRAARLALAAAEYVLGRPVRTVLDVGCGEATWRASLRRQRPGLRYAGLDPSPYTVRRYGRRRGILAGTFGELAAARPRGRADLVVCADVLHYLEDAEIRSGLPALAARIRGAAFIQVFVDGDAFDGDVAGWRPRPGAWYRRRFDEAGLVPLGLNCWTTRSIADERLSTLESS